MSEPRNILHLDPGTSGSRKNEPAGRKTNERRKNDKQRKNGGKASSMSIKADSRLDMNGDKDESCRTIATVASAASNGTAAASGDAAAAAGASASPDERIFALDIGTRTVIGVVGIEREDGFDVLDVEIHEHASRAMLDGQIHDIGIVANAARRVKEALEARLGYSLTKVAIAAAGRVLKTCQVHVERDSDETREIDQRLVSALEMEGIQKAQGELESGELRNERSTYYCVGYSVVTGWLNDFPIANLLGHKGWRVGMDILCTFLPQVVVDSLYSVMDRIGLEVSSLTLEPIAALNVAIPKDLRMLNLALVDIGAGTSDIALTRGGTVVAYAMAPTAGDEVTEAIAQQYLVDFNTAETIKLAYSAGRETIEFRDILDNAIATSSEEVQATVEPVVRQLAQTITERIVEFNGGKSPNAVFLVGGGSQVAGLPGMLSQMLGLPKERVAVRNRSIARNVRWMGDQLAGPECITPFGILVTAGMQKGQDFFHVTVNDAKIKLYNSRRLTVSDALLLAGFNPDQLIGKSGRALKFTVNGVEKTIRGGFAIPSDITVNGQSASLTTKVNPGDEIRVKPAEKGTDAMARAGDFVGASDPVHLQIGGSTIDVRPVFRINGIEAGEDAALSDGDAVEVGPPATLAEIAARCEIDLARYAFMINHMEVPGSLSPQPGMTILCRERFERSVERSAASASAAEVAAQAMQPASYRSNASVAPPSALTLDEGVPEPAPFIADCKETGDIAPTVTANPFGGPPGITVVANGETVFLPRKGKEWMYVDIFNHILFDLNEPKGSIVLMLNGREAGYTDTLQDGDEIRIFWKDS